MKKIYGIVENDPRSAMGAIRNGLGENLGEIINDALHHYALHPEYWSNPDELGSILVLLDACDHAGLNSIKPEYDVLRNPFLCKLYDKASGIYVKSAFELQLVALISRIAEREAT